MRNSAGTQSAVQSARVSSRAATDVIAAPIRLIFVIGGLFYAIVVLLILLLITRYINDNYAAFQAKLATDPQFEQSILVVINTIVELINIVNLVLQFAIEIWNYTVPLLDYLLYIFYRILVALFLTLFQQGQADPPIDGDVLKSPEGRVGSTPDPTSSISGGTLTFFNLLFCVLLDVLTIIAGVFKVLMRALAAMLMCVFDWVEDNLRKRWYRTEYCRTGGRVGSSDTWTIPNTDPVSGTPIYPDGSGPGNTCPDNSSIIQGLIKFITLVIDLARDVFIAVFPILADLFKSIFDAILKILPQLMQGIVQIIELFGPNAPMGKFLMFILNFMIQVIGVFLRSCVLQLIISIVMCLFNAVAAIVVNVVRGIIEAIAEIVCLGGLICNPQLPGSYMAWPDCDWTSVTQCFQQNYDSEQRNVSQACQPTVCNAFVRGTLEDMHKGMRATVGQYATPQHYDVAWHRGCVDAVTQQRSDREETVRTHMMCGIVREIAHAPVPLGIDPRDAPSPFDESHPGDPFCEVLQEESCLCRYASPICESQSCCLSFYLILVQQVLADLKMTSCADWEDKSVFAKVLCTSRTQRSLELGMHDLPGSSVHCDGFVSLVNASCYGRTPYTPDREERKRWLESRQPESKAIAGGMCRWIGDAGFCDNYRTITQVDPGIAMVRNAYNDFLRGHEERKADIRRRHMRSGSAPGGSRTGMADTQSFAHLFTEHRNLLSDHFNVASYTLTKAFPAAAVMMLSPVTDELMGVYAREPELYRDFATRKGVPRLIRRFHDDRWVDIIAGDRMTAMHINGSVIEWLYGDNGEDSDRPPDESAPYSYPDNLSSCGQNSNSGYPDGGGFQCGNERTTQTASATGGSLQVIIGSNQTQDKVDVMISNSSSQIYAQTTNRPSFQVPQTQYVAWMYNQTVAPPSNWNSNMTELNDQNRNWREPLTHKDNSANRPSGFTLYGTPPASFPLSMEECPIPTDFPWDRVFPRQTAFKATAHSWVEKLPRWLENSLGGASSGSETAARKTPEGEDLRSLFDAPDRIRQSANAMYGKRKTYVAQDVESFGTAWNRAVASLSKLSNGWESVKAARFDPKSHARTTSWFEAPTVKDVFDREEQRNRANDIGDDRTWTTGRQQKPRAPDPQINETLCINTVLNPYGCCGDSSTAYECCFGLLGCIPPPKNVDLSSIANLDFIIDATCGGTGGIIMSLFVLPRLFLSGWGWSVILLAPPWARMTLFRLLFPIVYDYGGLGATYNVFSDVFCFVVNLYWLVLIAMICLGAYVLDFVLISIYRDLVLKLDVAMTATQLAQLRESTRHELDLLGDRIDRNRSART